jgi:ribosome modulation factor
MVAFARQPISNVPGRRVFDPWIEGYDARTACHARSCNPYDRDTHARRLWDDGWFDAHEALAKAKIAKRLRF